MNSLPRPEDLLLKPPYHMVISGFFENFDGIEIQCSHAPSLKLLHEYLKKWSKQNHQDVREPSQIRVTLTESSFGLGILHDRLFLFPTARHYKVNMAIVLAFVEGVLGYTLADAAPGNWWYRREGELRL